MNKNKQVQAFKEAITLLVKHFGAVSLKGKKEQLEELALKTSSKSLNHFSLWVVIELDEEALPNKMLVVQEERISM